MVQRQLDAVCDRLAALEAYLDYTGVVKDATFQAYCHRRKFEALRCASCWMPGADVDFIRVFSIGDTFARIAASGHNCDTHNLVRACRDMYTVGHHLVSSAYIFGGATHVGSADNMIYQWDPCGTSWEVLPQRMPFRGVGHTAVVLERQIYLCGIDFNQFGGMVMAFSPIASTKKAWRVLSGVQSPHVRRARPSAAVLGGKLYLSGGANPNMMTEVYNSAERLHPKPMRWEILPPMADMRMSAASAPYNSKLLVCGGHGAIRPENAMQSAELYDTDEREWVAAPFMLTARLSHTAAFAHGSVYVCGGVGGDTFPDALKSAEVLHPRAAAWSALPDMLVPRTDAAVVVISGKVFVFGGCSGHGDNIPQLEFLQTVEHYNPQLRAWEAAPLMPERMSGCAAAVVCRMSPTCTAL